MFLLCASLALADDPKQSLVFHANFDKSTDAVKAAGDPKIYSAASYKDQASAVAGLTGTDVVLAPGRGRTGSALYFPTKNTKAVFYKAKDNVPFNAKNWSGTISFWLSLDPEIDLAPGYCDPIQVTDSSFDDSAIWVDFTKDDKPRHFRLGVFGEKSEWNPQNLNADKNEKFLNRLVVEKKYPFAKGQWTHVAIVHAGLGSGNGKASLYLNGKLIGEAKSIAESFLWDDTKSALRLGVNYTGYFDDLAIYSRPLTAAEVKSLSEGK